MNKTVYTAVIGDNYKLREPLFIHKQWDYICFSDRPRKSSVWKVVEFPLERNGKISSSKVKMLNDRFLPNTDLSIFIDSKFTVKTDLDRFVKKYKHPNAHLFMMNHNKRNCIYQEASYCIEKGIGEPEKIKEQIEVYRRQGYPQNNGLLATGVIIRDHNIEPQKQLMQKWFEQITEYSSRDQISLPYLLWKFNISCSVAPFKDIYRLFI